MTKITAIPLLCLSLLSTTVLAIDVQVTIGTKSLDVEHNGKNITVKRNQNPNATIPAPWNKTSRNCPPFCPQPIEIGRGVKTIGEVELIEFMQTQLTDGFGVIIDARTSKWHQDGTIPGSIHIPYTTFSTTSGADELSVEEALKKLGVARNESGDYDFSDAMQAVIWCNGPWCGQSPAAIHSLLNLGYPADQLLYYRGGMQMWQLYGLTVAEPVNH